MKHYKRLLAIILVLIIVIISFASCSTTGSTVEDERMNRFKVVEEAGNSYSDFPGHYYILVDTETNILYLCIREAYGNGLTTGLSPLLDETGTPMIWRGYYD